MKRFIITEEEKKDIRKLYESKEDINPKKLKFGDGGDKLPKFKRDVSILQQKLIDLGCLKTKSGKPTGYFGSLTDSALNTYNKKGSCKSTFTTDVPNPNINSGILDKNSSLLFDGDKLFWLSSGSIVKSWGAESGLTIKNAISSDDIIPYLNSFIQSKEEWMKEKNAGPIPTGEYIVGPLQTRSGDLPEIGPWEAFWLKISGQLSDDNQDFYINNLKSRIGWGNHRLAIKPKSGTNMYGRGDFYIHGGSLEGSHGCIDLTNNMEDFSKQFAAWSTYNKKNKMSLVVRYKDSLLDMITKALVQIDKGEQVNMKKIEGITDNYA